MKVRVLGCSGAIAAGSKTTSFLLNESVLVDAGTGVGDLRLDELARIDHIVVSHSHLDHILSIGLLADSVMRLRAAQGRPPISVHALPATLAALRTHIFNGVIWPDFTRLPSASAPILALHAFELGDRLSLATLTIEVVEAVHTVPAVGFAVQGKPGGGWWVFTGDTGPNPALWKRLQGRRLAHVVIETAFSDEETALARISSHLHPAALEAELRQIEGSVDVHITHIKPGEVDAVMRQIVMLQTAHRIHALAAGQVLHID
jgi:ribonuclease BN (tRNA processing enzyme)